MINIYRAIDLYHKQDQLNIAIHFFDVIYYNLMQLNATY